MFSRHSAAGSNKVEPRTTAANGTAGAQHHASGPKGDSKSVIGNDLKILGEGLKIIGRGVLQIDGQIDSDVEAAEVIVGEHGKVTGKSRKEQESEKQAERARNQPGPTGGSGRPTPKTN